MKVTLDCESFGAEGITVHPRPDERHIRYADVYELRPAVSTEFNIEGYPSEKFLDLVLKVKPDQVTLVPDAHDVITSNAGWDTRANLDFLSKIIDRCKGANIRTSIFVEPDLEMVEYAAKTGTDRIELYTEPYAVQYEQDREAAVAPFVKAAEHARSLGLGVNAGHDYNWFIQQMNEICRELGGTNSNFVNTNGLHDPNHYTCARDMALIGRELFQYPDFFRIAQTPQYTIPASATTEEHVFQQHHEMLLPDNSDYYPYAIGGKTGYTSDALSTLVTMADNGSMQLVCVVLKTHGINVYPDTRNLLEYAFQNFQKVSIAEQETSEDVEEILPDETAGYVVLPMEASFSDLSMELVPDGGLSTEAQLNYTYHGQPVGSARASLSDHYIKEHSAQPKDVSHKDQETETEDSGISDLQGKVILGAAVALLLILITALIRITRKRKQKTRRRRR